MRESKNTRKIKESKNTMKIKDAALKKMQGNRIQALMAYKMDVHQLTIYRWVKSSSDEFTKMKNVIALEKCLKMNREEIFESY